jgi:hypothetical protein
MILMSVSKKQKLYLVSFYSVIQKMTERILRKVYEQIVVYHRLASSSDIFTAKTSCLVAKLTVAKHRRKSFCRACSKIC